MNFYEIKKIQLKVVIAGLDQDLARNCANLRTVYAEKHLIVCQTLIGPHVGQCFFFKL